MRTTKAAFWTVASRQAERLLGIVSIAVLARLLTPHDFGVVALAASIVSIFEIFTSFGFDWALVRLKEPTREHYDTAWSLRVLLSCAVFAAILVAAWPLAHYLDNREVIPVLLAMGVLSVVVSAANIGIVDFRRNMQFDREFIMQVAAKVASFAIGVIAALLLNSYWALVAGIAAARLVTVITSYSMHPFRPRWSLEKRAELMSFSMWLLIGNVLDSVRQRFTDLWIGRSWGPGSVGIFSMSREISSLSTTEFAAPVNRVAFTRYSQAGDDRPALAAAFAQVSGIIWSVGLPAAAGTFVCSYEIILLLLGSQWSAGVTVLQILAVGGCLAILNANTVYILWAIHRGGFVCVTYLLSLVAFVAVALVLKPRFGLDGMAMAEALSTIPALIAIYVVLRRWVGVSLREVAARNWRVVVATIGMALLVWLLRMQVVVHLQWPLVFRLAALVIAGVFCYVFLLAGLWLLTGRRAGPEEYFAGIAGKGVGWLRRRFSAAH
jgi:O-antigen/teichoic acid export membrane protein